MPKRLYPGDETPVLPYFDDDWFRFYYLPGDKDNPTHYEVHEYPCGGLCGYRPTERCPFHPPNCKCCGDSMGCQVWFY